MFLNAGGPETCAVKVEDLPVEGNDMRTLMDMYSEVSIVEQFGGRHCISQLYDFGVTHDSLYMVMKEYKCSLLVSTICNSTGTADENPGLVYAQADGLSHHAFTGCWISTCSGDWIKLYLGTVTHSVDE